MTETTRNVDVDFIPAPVVTQLADSISPEQPVCQSVVIGNITGANLLTCAIMNKQGPLGTSLSAGQMLTSHDFVNMLALSPKQPDTNQLSKNHSTSTLAVPSASSLDILQDLDTHKTFEDKSQLCEPSSKASDSENFRVQLASSDTVFLGSGSLSTSDTLPVSSLCILNDSDIENTLSKDKASLSGTSKPFSLLTNISDRSVSLESIPSLGLLQLDHEHASNFSLYRSDSEDTTSGSSKVVSEQIISQITDCQITSETTVLESRRIPESVMHLMKHFKHVKSPDQQVCLLTSQGKANSSTSLPDQDSNDQEEDCSLAANRMNGAVEERNGDTDAEMQSEAVSVINNQELSRSDTVILNVSKDNTVASSSSDLQTADTVVLACEDKQVHSNERLSEGFSFTSVNSSGPSSYELQINKSLINKPPSVLCNPLLNQSSETLPVLASQNDNVNKSLYVVTSEGYLAAVRYVSSNPLEVSQLVQLRLINHVDANHQVLNPCVPETLSRNMETKETQTELVFGTSTLQFKLEDTEEDNGICSVHQLGNLAFSNPLPEKTTVVPSIIVINGHAKPPAQPQGTVISLAEPTGDGKIAPTNQMALNQFTECGSTPLQTSEPGLPDTSHTDSCAAFKCMECPDAFKTKHGLVSHEKLHKRGFKCDLCNATFTRIGNFTRHRKIHKLETESENLFKCNDCGREFLQRCDLKRHQLIHAKQEPHRCEKCGKGYIRRSDLVVHMRFHNKDKAFKCSMCEKKFFQTGDLSRHVRRAHMPNSHLTCGHCNRKYACEATLIRHMKAAHKDIILRTVNTASETLQESNSSDKGPSVSAKDVLFTMTTRPERKL
ncbi:hypothetical protein BsWGS_04366 [Bradybaena similaris]